MLALALAAGWMGPSLGHRALGVRSEPRAIRLSVWPLAGVRTEGRQQRQAVCSVAQMVSNGDWRSRSEDAHGNRTYVWGNESFISVTTILANSIPKYLVPWASRLVAEAAVDRQAEWSQLGRESAVALLKDVPNQSRAASANLGKDIHAAVEAHVLGRPMPAWTPDVAPSMGQFTQFLIDFDPIIVASEASVFHRTHGWAGTGDLWATPQRGKLAGKPLIIDAKTGKGIYAEVALQLSAYARGEFIGLPDGSEIAPPPVEGGAVLHLRPDTYAFREVSISDEIYKVFRHCAMVARFNLETSKSVIGEAMRP